MTLLARIRLILRRFGLSFVVYVFLMLLVAIAQKQLFVAPDMTIAGAIDERKSPPHLDSQIVLVDLASDEQHTWRSTAEFLSIVSRRTSYPPEKIVLDIYFSANHSEPGISNAEFAEQISKVRDKLRIPIYATVDPLQLNSPDLESDCGQARIDPKIYNALSGSGHTEWARVANIGLYRATLPCPSDPKVSEDFYALPLTVTGDFADPNARYLFAIGASEPHHYSLADVRRDPALFAGKIVVVGSTKSGDQNRGSSGAVSGMDYTAWAISERIAAGKSGHVSFFTDPGFGIAIALVLSLCSALAFRIAFLVEPSLSRKLPMACAAGALVPLVLFALIVAAFATANLIYARPSSALSSILVTTISAWSAGRVQIRYKRIVEVLKEDPTRARCRSDVFVSYSRDDENAAWVQENIVKPLERSVKADGTKVKVFFDQANIGSGMQWYQSIVDALWGTRFVVSVYTPRYFERPMCSTELLEAMRRAVNEPAFRVFPVSRMPVSAIPPEFSGMQIVDARKPAFIDEIIAAVCAPVQSTVPTVRYDSGEVEVHAKK